MTLKEAYEMKRREVFSLHIENARLQKQVAKLSDSRFPAEENTFYTQRLCNRIRSPT